MCSSLDVFLCLAHIGLPDEVFLGESRLKRVQRRREIALDSGERVTHVARVHTVLLAQVLEYHHLLLFWLKDVVAAECEFPCTQCSVQRARVAAPGPADTVCQFGEPCVTCCLRLIYAEGCQKRVGAPGNLGIAVEFGVVIVPCLVVYE